MNDFFEENKRPLILMVLALLLFSIAIYFFFVKPEQNKAKRAEDNIASLQEDIKRLEVNLASLEEEQADFDVDIESLLLEKKIPTERKLADYIIDLEKMEASAGAVIQDISFTYETSLEIEETGEDDSSEDEVTDTEEDEDDELANEFEVDEAEVSEATEQLISEMPEEIQAFTVTMTIHVLDFDDFLYFLETVEEQERLSIVTRISLDQPTEVDDLDPESIEKPTFQVDVTSFYYPN